MKEAPKFITDDKNEWVGWMVFSRRGSQIGLVPSSFSLSKTAVDAVLKTRYGMGKRDEEVRQVRMILEG